MQFLTNNSRSIRTGCFLIGCAIALLACTRQPDNTRFTATPLASQTATPTAVPPTPTFTPLPPTPSPTPDGLPYPIRAAYYQPFYPESWRDESGALRTRFNPRSGLYSIEDTETIARQIDEMKYAGIQAGLILWRGTPDEDGRLEKLFDGAVGKDFYWGLLYAPPADQPAAPETASALIEGIFKDFANRREYLRITGKPVLFLDLPGPGCETLEPWLQASQGRFYLAAAAAMDAALCPDQPDAWYPVLTPGQSAASTADAALVRPGYWPFDARMELFRLPQRWQADLETSFSPGLKFHLVDSYNNWAAGTVVEPAVEWSIESGMGTYLDVLSDSTTPIQESFILSGAGDITVCDWPFDDQVSDLFNVIPGEIFTLGDNSNEEGTQEQFRRCFADSWGRFLERIHPTPGNHDYVQLGARPYFEYFGERAGEPGKGYYSYTLGSWQIIVLNGNCSAVGGCYAGSDQETWLRSELQANPSLCTLAYWHQPRWSSGIHGGSDTYDAFWRALYDAGAEMVLNGHDHQYERFAPQNPDGALDEQRGIRQFIAGTGGASTRWTNAPTANSEILQTGVNGLLALTLKPQGYEWQFIPALGESFTDWGSAACR